MRIALAILVFVNHCVLAQEFDRSLEKEIKTEINLNRIAKSQNPLDLSSYYKKFADSITQVTFNSYFANSQENSRGVKEDWDKIWVPVSEEFQKDQHPDINVMVISDGDYKKRLKECIYNKAAFFYKLENNSITVSAMKLEKKIFLTVLTW